MVGDPVSVQYQFPAMHCEGEDAGDQRQDEQGRKNLRPGRPLRMQGDDGDDDQGEARTDQQGKQPGEGAGRRELEFLLLHASAAPANGARTCRTISALKCASMAVSMPWRQ